MVTTVFATWGTLAHCLARQLLAAHAPFVLQTHIRTMRALPNALHAPPWIQTLARIAPQGVRHLLLAFATWATQDRTAAHAPFAV